MLTFTLVYAIEFAMHMRIPVVFPILSFITACWQLPALRVWYHSTSYQLLSNKLFNTPIIVMPHLPQVGPRRGICIWGGFGPTWGRWGMTLIGANYLTFLTEWIHRSSLGCWWWSFWSGKAASAVPSKPGHWKQCELCHLLCQHNHVVLQWSCFYRVELMGHLIE